MSATPYYRVDAEHSGELGREAWVLGPPGCGKSTFLAGSIRNTALQRGNHNVAVASFTTAAATEIAGRGLGLPKSQVGTLHSLAYRQLDHPPVAEDHVDDWNTHHRALALTGGRKTSADDGAPVEANTGGATDGDALANQVEILRARMVPVEAWPAGARAFHDKWEGWKAAEGLIDFTDMIDHALHDVGTAPGNPDVIFADESQDFVPLEFALIRKWAQSAERLVLAGDPNQSIYGFRGAEPDTWLGKPIPDADKIVLSQSWRIPASVHRAAEHWIRQQSTFEEMRYDPRSEEGLVRQIAENWMQPQLLADQVEKSLQGVDVDNDGVERPATVMVLASCAYMLDPLKHELRARGLPFSNPWRTSRGDWNPMRTAGTGVSSRERLLAYLVLDERHFGDRSRPWTGADVKRWAHVVKKQGIFVRGAVAAIAALPDRELDFETELAPLFANEVDLEQAVTPDVGWFSRNLLAAATQGMAFPLEVVRRRGVEGLIDEPRVHIGTCHSFKGSQATVVYMIPDLSSRGATEWGKLGGPQDGVRRLMYVGMTRARRELAVCNPATQKFVPPEQIIAGARRNAT